MTTIERPIKKALGDALDIYRDAMRPFVIRNLKRVPGKNLEDAIGAVLRDGQYNRFRENLQDGRSVEDAIDIGEFPQLIHRYWHDVFRAAFRRDMPSLGAVLHAVTEARNRVAHPDGKDIELDYAKNALNDIAAVLAEINAPDRRREVEAIRDSITPFSTPAHPRCGTAFLLTVMVVAILVFVFIPREPLWWLITSRVIFIPAIAALAYELIRFSGRYEDNPMVKIISAPNLLLQKLTTRYPDDDQIEVAATAMRTALEADGETA